ncbi:hypothetical protein BJX61DRAFT_547619 [Aspergillus egyptiacus]|nr:hypothetical protein BJX61DRAFT_547619 [Aspergillus egyptiacus]
MSRNFVPAVLAIAMGIGTGYYTFQPALRELRIEQAEKAPVPEYVDQTSIDQYATEME